MAQQALELRGRRVAPGAGHGLGRVEIGRSRLRVLLQVPGEGPEARAGGVGGGRLRGGVEGGEGVVAGEGAAREGEARAQLLATLGGVEGQLRGQLGARDEHAGNAIAEEALKEALQAGEDAGAVAVTQLGLERRGELGAHVGGDLRVGEHRHAEDQAVDRLHQAEPLLVEAPLAVVHVSASGIMTTRPIGVSRCMRTSYRASIAAGSDDELARQRLTAVREVLEIEIELAALVLVFQIEEARLAQAGVGGADGLALVLEQGSQLLALLAGSLGQAALGVGDQRVGLGLELRPQRGEQGLGACARTRLVMVALGARAPAASRRSARATAPAAVARSL